jgi:hypothetical protein
MRTSNDAVGGEELYLVHNTADDGGPPGKAFGSISEQERAAWNTTAAWVEQECSQRFLDGRMAEKRYRQHAMSADSPKPIKMT